MRALYTTAIQLYSSAIHLASCFGHKKAKQWVEGRQKDRYREWDDDDKWIWFHAASLGEFEQGRPLIEALKKEHPEIKICLSFFSPSGYEIRKNYPLADEIVYLPSDTPRHASHWVKRHHFIAAFFIKYEFWFNYMQALAEASIPLYYISLILRPNQYFFKWYGGWFRKQLKTVTHFFVQDEPTSKLLYRIGFQNVTVCGDTRFDRVAAIAKQVKAFPEMEDFIDGRRCIIAGSSWQPDEKLIAGYIAQLPEDYCMIIAPHDISESHIRQIQVQFPEAQLYTKLESNKKCKILILNTIGILSQLYQYARFVYIGGGFGVNIHNIQEPVTFGCPVVFGPKYKSFKEAVDLVRLGGAFSISDQEAFNRIFRQLIEDDEFYHKASETCRSYLESQLGATDSIMSHITSSFSV